MKPNFRESSIGIFTFVLLGILYTSCAWDRKNPEHGYYYQDFDNFYKWDHSSQITPIYAHSGEYCTYVDSLHPYSMTFKDHYKLAKIKGYKKMKVSAWLMSNEPVKETSIVASISYPDSEAVYKAINIKNMMPYKSAWTQVKMELDIPQDLPENLLIKFYLWSHKKERVFMDDVEVEFFR